MSPVGTVLNTTEALGQVSISPKKSGALRQVHFSPKKTSGSGLVGPLVRNTVVMTDGVASDLVITGRGLVDKPSPGPTGSNNISPLKVNSGLSNTFAILDSSLIEDGQFLPAMEMASVLLYLKRVLLPLASFGH